jgi:hypothetical protein
VDGLLSCQLKPQIQMPHRPGGQKKQKADDLRQLTDCSLARVYIFGLGWGPAEGLPYALLLCVPVSCVCVYLDTIKKKESSFKFKIDDLNEM